MKKILIISPYFPPTNAADMQRIRMSLPYFRQYGWEVEVVTVDPKYSQMSTDDLLMKTIPGNIVIHQVKAFHIKWTSKLGLGSLALRSLWFFKNKVDQLLETKCYDLIYFSTTQFPVCILGAHWKKKFGVPYVIDMQDPWHSDYYQNKPKNEQPPKYWFSYRLNKWMEPKAMVNCDGIISVSQKYIDNLRKHYPVLASKPASVITFGASKIDSDLASQYRTDPANFHIEVAYKSLIYIGRGGFDMKKSVGIIFKLFKKGLQLDSALFQRFRFYFLGTSYAPPGAAVIKTFKSLACEMEVGDYVVEQTERIPYFASLSLLQQASGLVLPGSDDPGYTASKIYNNMAAGRPLFCLFHEQSSVHEILKKCTAGYTCSFNQDEVQLYDIFKQFLENCVDLKWTNRMNEREFKEFTAEMMTRKQVTLFESVLNDKNI